MRRDPLDLGSKMTEVEMSDDLYRKLQQYLDKLSMGFPATESGIDIKILKALFTEADAELFLSMTQKLETPEDIAARLGRDVAQTAAQLKDMRDRGLLFSMEKGGITRYSTIQFVHGIFEFQVTRLGREFAQMFEDYYNEALGNAIFIATPTFMRTIPVQESVEAKHVVATYNDAVEILRSQPLISVSECVCRKEQEVRGIKSDKPKETCFMFGAMAKYYIDNKLGRQVSSEEAIRMLKESEKAGMVTQPAAAQNPAALCSCVGDSCIVLRALNLSEKPADHVTSNYQTFIDATSCTGCEACLDSCHMHAITMKDDIADVNLDRCIGCGLCVRACPAEAIQMTPKTNQPYIPESLMEQMQLMAKARKLAAQK